MRIPGIILILALLFTTQNIYSQDYITPADYVLESKEDYAKYEKDIVAAAKWLLQTPLNEQ